MTAQQRYAALTFGTAHQAGARNPVGASTSISRAAGLGCYSESAPAPTSTSNLLLMGVG